MSLDVAAVSVITSGCVAIAGILFPLVLNFIMDSRKWSRERKAAKLEGITKTTTALLDKLADFRSGDVQRASRSTAPEAYSDLLSRYYTWEQAIWSHCGKTNQERLKQLRPQFENGNYETLHDSGPKLASEILELAHAASERRK